MVFTNLCSVWTRMPHVYKVLQTCYRQLWYLSGDLVTMALVDTGLTSIQREELAKAIHAIPKPDEPRKGKPKFPNLTFFLIPHPQPPPLASLVTVHSWAIFNRLGLKGCNDWLLAPSSLWHLFTEYRKLEDFVKNLTVFNNIAERGCTLMTEFVNRVRSEESRQALVLSVAYHRKLVSGFNKSNLEKC